MPYLLTGGLCLAVFCVLLYIEPRNFVNVLDLLAAAVLIFIGFADVTQHVEYITGGLYLFLYGVVPALMLFIAVLLIYSLLYLRLPKDMDCDYIIVHGCGLLGGTRVSPLLRGRVDKAVEIYRKLNGRAKLVLSGGQGADEKLTEAQAMKEYLAGQDFPQEDIILEDSSATTYENLRNVKEMLDTDGQKHRYIFVTNDHHVFRTSLFARSLGMDAAGVGCRTAPYYWPSAFIREYIAVMVRYKWITIAVLLIWLLLMIVSLLPF